MAIEIGPRALRLDIRKVVEELSDVLGTSSVALLGGVRDTRSVRGWMAGDYAPRDQQPLRFALQLVDILRTREKPDVIRAWFEGVNHLLEDENPLLVIARSSDATTKKALVSAARQFISE